MQVYQEARASDPTLAGAEATKLATDENVDQARSQLLPQIAAALSYTRTTGGSNSPSFVHRSRQRRQRARTRHHRTTFYTRSLGATLDQSLVDISKLDRAEIEQVTRPKPAPQPTTPRSNS